MYNTRLAKSLKFITFNEGVVYKSELAKPEEGEDWSFLVSIPLRVGLEKVDQVYIPQLKEILLYPDWVGVLGGKKHAAMYYVGFNKSGVLTLDPHTTQKWVSEINEDTINTYRTTNLKHLKWSQLDTTMAFWFYLNNEENVEKFLEVITMWKKFFSDDYLIGLRDEKATAPIDIEGEIEDDFEIL